MHATFHPETGPPVHLSADTGIFFVDSDALDLEGDAVASQNDMRISAERFHYDQASRKLTTDAPVRLIGNGFAYEADGMIHDVTREELTLTGNVKGVLDETRLSSP